MAGRRKRRTWRHVPESWKSMTTELPTFKVLLVGDGGCGKTAFLKVLVLLCSTTINLSKRHLKGEFERKYIATMGVEVHPIVFQTNHGPIRFNCWDTAGMTNLISGFYYLQRARKIWRPKRRILYSRTSCFGLFWYYLGGVVLNS